MSEANLKVTIVGPFISGRSSALAWLVGRPEQRQLVRASPHALTVEIDGRPVHTEVATNVVREWISYDDPTDASLRPELRQEIAQTVNADGFLFVVDSRKVRAEANLGAYESLKRDLAAYGRAIAEVPIVFLLNVREDASDHLDVEWLRDHVCADAVHVLSNLRRGEGVREGLLQLVKRIVVRKAATS